MTVVPPARTRRTASLRSTRKTDRPAERAASADPEISSGPTRAAIVQRMWNAADAQVREIESRLRSGVRAASEREQDARVLATLSRTLRELVALDAAAQPARAPDEDDTQDDDGPLDLDGFRRELESRLEGIRQQRSGRGD